MPRIKFTSALKRFFPDLRDIEVEGSKLSELIHNINLSFPGISNYIVEENGNLREHVNIYLDGKMIQDRDQLSDKVDDKNEVVIFQAISGG